MPTVLDQPFRSCTKFATRECNAAPVTLPIVVAPPFSLFDLHQTTLFSFLGCFRSTGRSLILWLSGVVIGLSPVDLRELPLFSHFRISFTLYRVVSFSNFHYTS